MILNHQQIIEACRTGGITLVPFEESRVEAATYDLRVGEQGATTSTKKLVNIREAGYMLLQPGDFAVVTVLEEMRLSSSYAGRFGLRSKYARKGIIATTGPQIDPGYHGRLILGLTNLSPKSISLPYKDDFVSVEFHKLEEPTRRPYAGPYQDRLELGPEEIEAITETEGMALSEVIATLRSLSQNVAQLASEVKLPGSLISWAKRYWKPGGLALCLFVLYAVILGNVIPVSNGAEVFLGSLAATALTSFLYNRIAKKIGL